jgi:hypothetical protein
MKKTTRERQAEIQRQVDSLRKDGFAVEDAFYKVSEKMFLSFETIRQNYYAFGSYKPGETKK